MYQQAAEEGGAGTHGRCQKGGGSSGLMSSELEWEGKRRPSWGNKQVTDLSGSH